MTKKELKELKQLFLVNLLYTRVESLYVMEASRGYRPDVRSTLEEIYSKFSEENEKLKKENQIKSAISLKLSA